MKKQVLFLLTLLLAFAPACSKQKNKSHLAGPNSAIAAGSILTAGGTATGVTTAVLIGSLSTKAACLGTLGLVPPLIGCFAATPILLAIGIPLLVMGAIKRNKKIKKFRMRQKLESITQPKSNAPEIAAQ